MDVAPELILLVAAIFVPTLAATLPTPIPERHRYALAAIGLAGIALFPFLTLARAIVYAAAAAIATAWLARTGARVRHLALALSATLTIMTAALAWVSTLA